MQSQSHNPRQIEVSRSGVGLFGSNLAQTFHLKDAQVIASSGAGEKAFAVTHLVSPTGLPDLTKSLISEPALHVSVSLAPMPMGSYQQWHDGKCMDVPFVPAYTTSVMDLEAELFSLVMAGFDYMHFYVPKTSLNEIAREHGIREVGEFRFVIGEEDLVVAQLARLLLPSFSGGAGECRLCLDSIGVVLGAHLIQRYSGVSKALQVPNIDKLAPWHKARIISMVRDNIAGDIRLADIAGECRLSPSHFARCFKATFGCSVHQWVMGQRLEMAKSQLSHTNKSVMDIAMEVGFSDQAALTRRFTQTLGISPGRWRRQNAVVVRP